MPKGPAARVTDNVSHPLPPVLQPGLGALTVWIGSKFAWRGLPLAAVAALQAAKSAADATIQTAEAATKAAAGTPGAPAALAAEQAAKAAALASMSALITPAAGGGTDIHICTTPTPVPPHGPGVVIDGSATVMINNLPACRMGDTLLEAIGPPNKIAAGCTSVVIGG
ncbi:MAG: PAAR domain-containing protein [Rhodoferax sp.]